MKDASVLIDEVERRNRGTEIGKRVKTKFIHQALVAVLREPRHMNPGLVRECLGDARRLEAEAKETEGLKEDKSSMVPKLGSDLPPPQLAGWVFDALDSEVRKVRRQLFEVNPEGLEPPFSDWGQAVTWLNEQKAEGAPQNVDWEESNQLMELVKEACRSIERLTGEQILITRRFPQLDIYAEPGSSRSQRRSISVKRWNRKLRVLLAFVDEAQRTTGLPRTFSLLYLLTGERRIPRTSVRVIGPVGTSIPRTSVTFWQTTPKQEDVKRACRDLRELASGERRKDWRKGKRPPRGMSLEIATSVRNLGGVPEKGKMKFWPRVVDDLRKRAVPGARKIKEQSAYNRFYRLPAEYRVGLE